MDYDKTEISSVYDETRGLESDQLKVWLDLVHRDAHPDPGALIVDLGCGTGRFSEPLAERFSARVIAVDPSEKMLDVARRKSKTSRVEFLQSPADSLSLADSAADIVFMSMVFHHLENPRAAAGECRRVLRSGGRVCLRNVTLEANFPHRRFFPGVEADLPARRTIETVFAAAGLTAVARDTVTQVVSPTWSDFAKKISLRAYSTLARLSDDEFERGMAALNSHAASRSPTEIVTEEVDWFVFRAD